MITGSISIECDRRLTNLYIESNQWLVKEAKKITKNKEEAEDLVQELFEYLHKKKNPKLWWGDNSYNLYYCNKFLHSRFMNKVKKLNKTSYGYTGNEAFEIEDTAYNEERDLAIHKAHEDVMAELDKLKITRMWPQAKIFELYWCSDDTLDEVAHKIGISKSTCFLAVKRCRKYLEQVIQNPFDV
jgi:RNA polymerase sigma factor (sigma-70 family)